MKGAPGGPGEEAEAAAQIHCPWRCAPPGGLGGSCHDCVYSCLYVFVSVVFVFVCLFLASAGLACSSRRRRAGAANAGLPGAPRDAQIRACTARPLCQSPPFAAFDDCELARALFAVGYEGRQEGTRRQEPPLFDACLRSFALPPGTLPTLRRPWRHFAPRAGPPRRRPIGSSGRCLTSGGALIN